MMQILTGTRILQSRNNLKRGTYEIYNNQLKEIVEISWFGKQILNYAFKHNRFDFLPHEYLKQLVDIGIIVESEAEVSPVFCKPCCNRYPLSALNIEITNICNYNCNHCYGAFPQFSHPEFIPFKWLKTVLPELNKLHTKSISITGGEPTLHPKFIEIVQFFLKNGFEVCVFTNGSNPQIISKLLNATKQYYYRIKVSLDGTIDFHNAIRGNANAFNNAIKTLDKICMHDNVSLCISTTVQKNNIGNVNELSTFVTERYPSALHTKDIAFPMGNGCDCAFGTKELDQVQTYLPELFKTIKSDKNTNTRKLLRCSGGVSQCTLMSNGKLKICNAACDKRFEFRYNAFEKGLRYAWIHCGSNIQKFRQEKDRSTKACKKCEYRKMCLGNDCRVLAFAYTGSELNNNPLTCCTAAYSKEDNS